jgi:ribonuclease III
MKDYSKLEKVISVKLKNKGLMEKAFIHRSYLNEHREEVFESNERMEFLGDAVLELAATRHLYEVCPDESEGAMTSFRAALVRGKNLAEVGRKLELGQYLFLSNGEEQSGGREKNYILANTVEALIGAIYLDQGYEVAEKFISKFILEKLDEIIEKGLHVDSKSKFQEICQEVEGHTPNYAVIAAEGPDHDKKFTMGAYIKEKLIAKGFGSSKQNAEDDAAKKALKEKGWK